MTGTGRGALSGSGLNVGDHRNSLRQVVSLISINRFYLQKPMQSTHYLQGFSPIWGRR